MGAICAFATVACMDNSFDISNVSTEVTIGSGTTVLPLGYLENKTIGDLLGNQEIEGLDKDEEGNLSFHISGAGEPIMIDGITTEFEIDAITNTFAVDYPQFEMNMEPIEIEAEEDVTVDLGALDSYITEIPGIDGFVIPEGLDLPALTGTFSRTFSEADQDEMHMDFVLPDQVENVSKIYFKDLDDIHDGAPMHLRVDFNDLAGINGGGELEFALSIKGGRFTLLDAENNVIHSEDDGNRYVQRYAVEDGAEYVDFVIYLESITNDTPLTEDHHLDLPLELTYDMTFTLQAKAGTFKTNDMPHISLEADFQYGDALLDIKDHVALVDYHHEQPDPIVINGLPEQVKAVNSVSLVDGDTFKLYATGLEWISDEITEQMEIVITLPDYLVLHDYDKTKCHYENGKLYSTIGALNEENGGIQVYVDALDFGDDGLTPDDNGNIELLFAIDFVADFTDDAHVCASQLEHEGTLDITVGVEPMTLTIESVEGYVNYNYEVDEEFALEGLEQLDVEIGGAGLKPVIEVHISNPLTMQPMLEGSITPISGGAAVVDNRVVVPETKLSAAKYEDGEITPADVTLVIADESLRDNYKGAKYTFVACDVTKLLLGHIPDALDIDLSLGVDDKTPQTIYLVDGPMEVKYDYTVNVPIAFDENLEITYNGQINGLNSQFEGLAVGDMKVGDIVLIATVTNTTPLQFAPSVALYDKDGNKTDAQVIVDEGAKILGSSDGETPAESQLRLGFDFGEDGLVSNIAAIDAVRMQLVATSAAQETAVPLKESQYLGVKLQLELAGGITLDLMPDVEE